MKTALVTGGAGFIGSHIVDAYIDRGLSVTVLDNLSTGDKANLNPRARFVAGDIRDIDAINRALGDGVDVLNHHAAQIDVRRSVADPAFDADVNIVGAVRLLERARQLAVKKVIFASSGGAGYGEPQSYPQTEDHATRPISPYGCAKIAFEHYLFYYARIFNLPYAALRYANVYGPRQRQDGEAGVVAIFTGKLLSGAAATINGSGEQTRDYVFVEDVVRANVAALDDRITGEFNVGTGVETNVVELFAMLQKLIGGPDATHAPAKTGEQMRSVLDGRKLRKLAGLPDAVPLEQGLRKTVAWFRRQPVEGRLSSA